jgi:hypothetical protein
MILLFLIVILIQPLQIVLCWHIYCKACFIRRVKYAPSTGRSTTRCTSVRRTRWSHTIRASISTPIRPTIVRSSTSSSKARKRKQKTTPFEDSKNKSLNYAKLVSSFLFLFQLYILYIFILYFINRVFCWRLRNYKFFYFSISLQYILFILLYTLIFILLLISIF